MKEGKFFAVAPGITLNVPAFQQCVCGQNLVDWNGSGSRQYTPCCQLTYLNDKVIGVGPVWLNQPLRPSTVKSTTGRLETLANAAPPPDGMTTALYRRYDNDDVLLYVGISDRLMDRSSWHRRHSPWSPFVARRTTEWFPSRAEAAAAEVRAIKNERPLFNRQHANPEMREQLAQYLRQPGRILLVEQDEPPPSPK